MKKELAPILFHHSSDHVAYYMFPERPKEEQALKDQGPNRRGICFVAQLPLTHLASTDSFYRKARQIDSNQTLGMLVTTMFEAFLLHSAISGPAAAFYHRCLLLYTGS